MKISEAKQIVGKMVLWTMMANGIEPNEKPDPITEDLETLLKANRICEKNNERTLKGRSKKGTRTVQMTIADRGIAALYVAANYAGNTTEDCQVLGFHKDNIVLCLNKKELK